MEQQTYTLEAFQQKAKELARELAPRSTATVVALHGDLGAGKTTFVQNMARALGVTADVVSPTFVIQKYYSLHEQAFAQLVHIDAYRIESPDELAALSWDELVREAQNLIVIEWAERVAELLPIHTLHVHLAYIDENMRSIAYEKTDA